jgi:hypothetical protein
MIVKRGEIWLANLNPTRGSEQAGTRPVLIFQHDVISQFRGSRSFGAKNNDLLYILELHILT